MRGLNSKPPNNDITKYKTVVLWYVRQALQADVWEPAFRTPLCHLYDISRTKGYGEQRSTIAGKVCLSEYMSDERDDGSGTVG